MRSLQVTVSDKRSFPVAKTRRSANRWSMSRCITVVFRPVQGGEDITLRLKQWQYNPIEKARRAR